MPIDSGALALSQGHLQRRDGRGLKVLLVPDASGVSVEGAETGVFGMALL